MKAVFPGAIRLDGQSVSKIVTSYGLICKCYPDVAIAAVGSGASARTGARCTRRRGSLFRFTRLRAKPVAKRARHEHLQMRSPV
jgi:hypothetical protein